MISLGSVRVKDPHTEKNLEGGRVVTAVRLAAPTVPALARRFGTVSVFGSPKRAERRYAWR